MRANLADIPWLIRCATLPPGCIGRFFHEMSHHMIFDTSLSRELAFLESQAQTTAILGKYPKQVKPATLILDSLLRVWVTSECLKPLAEGLALYAEHDIYDRSEEHTSELQSHSFIS